MLKRDTENMFTWMSGYIYACACVCICVYVYKYICIHRCIYAYVFIPCCVMDVCYMVSPIIISHKTLTAGALQRLSNRASADTALNLQILATRNCIIVMPYPFGSMSIHLFTTRVYPTFFHIVMLFNADGLQMAYSHVAPGHQQTCCWTYNNYIHTKVTM